LTGGKEPAASYVRSGVAAAAAAALAGLSAPRDLPMEISSSQRTTSTGSPPPMGHNRFRTLKAEFKDFRQKTFFTAVQQILNLTSVCATFARRKKVYIENP
jgi:hypothetical protein